MGSGDSQHADLDELILGLRLLLLDFDGVFTNNMVYVFEDGREVVRCSRADGIGLRRLERSGVQAMILSTEVNRVVSSRANKLKIRCRQGCEDKAAALAQICTEFDVDRSQVGFVGNDVNDLGVLSLVGLPMVVADGYPEVKAIARHITTCRGGEGAVREVCDWIAAKREGEADRLSQSPRQLEPT